jgi:hypothetical protein
MPHRGGHSSARWVQSRCPNLAPVI